MARNGKIIIAKDIKLDKRYKEVLNYSESDMLNLVNTNKVADASNYSFIREKGVISVNFSYTDCLKCNYMAFQNTDYDLKWFFAFIDKVEYVNNATTNIYYTIDAWSTWFSKLTVKSSYVIREHVSDDSVGLHTLPENLDTGEYVINDIENIDDSNQGLTSTVIAVGVSWCPDNTSTLVPSYSENKQYGGVFSGLTYFLFSDASSCTKFIKAYDDLAKSDAIYSVFLVPLALVSGLTWYTFNLGNQSNIVSAIPSYTTFSTTLISNKQYTSPSSLNGYTPKNNKLKCYPYNYLYITNNSGIDVTYNYEDFVNNTAVFNIDGVLTTGCSIRLFPANYKKYNTQTNYPKYDSVYGITGTKYPTCSWVTDPYTNWLTQNAVNNITAPAKIVATSLQNPTNGVFSILDTFNNYYQHSLVPEQAKGNTSSGDVLMGMRMINFTVYKMSIRAEYARVIDDFFTRKGYKINRLKVPNITGRRYFNYIQIASEDVLGYGEIPEEYMQTINDIARNGVTIWHDHDNLGDYSVNNSII